MLLVCMILPIARPTEAGLVIMAVSPMAPFVVGKMLGVGSDRAYSVGLYVAFILASVIIVPLTLLGLNALFGVTLRPSAAALAVFVAKSVLLPVAAGILIGSLWPRFGARAAPIVTIIAYVGILPVLLLILWARGAGIMALIGDGTVAAIVITIVVSLAGGHFLGGPLPERRRALAQAATTRHPGIAVLIARNSFQDESITLAIILFLLVSIVIGAAYGRWAMGRADRRPG
jgi:BASS family bile acid:Na+ symporter